MYVRHAAWLNATPKESDKPRRETFSEVHQELTDLDEYEQHIIKLWREAGSVSQGGMGVAPLVWEEIITWVDRFYLTDKIIMVPRTTVRTTDKWVKESFWKRGKIISEAETIVEEIPIVVKQCSLEDYEVELIMQLSREYCDEYHSATDPQRPCPREIFLDDVDEMSNADAMLAGFKALWGNGNQETKPEVINNNF